MLRNYLKIALRNLLRNKVYSFINIGGLAVGMAQKQDDGVHSVVVTPGLLANVLKKDFPEIEQTVRIGRQGGLLQYEDKILETDNILVTDPSL